jgi:hypothetical protein
MSVPRAAYAALAAIADDLRETLAVKHAIVLIADRICVVRTTSAEGRQRLIRALRQLADDLEAGGTGETVVVTSSESETPKT